VVVGWNTGISWHTCSPVSGRDTTWSVTVFEHCYALTTPEVQ
jgi:hypothetical protein